VAVRLYVTLYALHAMGVGTSVDGRGGQHRGMGKRKNGSGIFILTAVIGGVMSLILGHGQGTA